MSDVERARAADGGAPLWNGATWTARMRSAGTRNLDVRRVFVVAAGVRMRPSAAYGAAFRAFGGAGLRSLSRCEPRFVYADIKQLTTD